MKEVKGVLNEMLLGKRRWKANVNPKRNVA